MLRTGSCIDQAARCQNCFPLAVSSRAFHLDARAVLARDTISYCVYQVGLRQEMCLFWLERSLCGLCCCHVVHAAAGVVVAVIMQCFVWNVLSPLFFVVVMPLCMPLPQRSPDPRIRFSRCSRLRRYVGRPRVSGALLWS